MKILVACEYSGRTRDALIEKGHDAMSCDFLPTERPGPHYQGDVRDVLESHWDGMIAHPDCTFLSSSGIHWNSNPNSYRFGGGKRRKLWSFSDFCSIKISNLLPLKIRQALQIHWLENQIKLSSRINSAMMRARPHVYGLKIFLRLFQQKIIPRVW